MLSRYLKVFWRKVLFLILAIALIVVSSVTKGKTAIVFSTITGIILISVAIYYVVWIIRTPTKTEKDDGV